jgi:hypothetical protein
MKTHVIPMLAAAASLIAWLWEAVPMVTQAMCNSGNTGGGGCRIRNELAIDSADNFLLMGTDVGSIYWSMTVGANWEL